MAIRDDIAKRAKQISLAFGLLLLILGFAVAVQAGGAGDNLSDSEMLSTFNIAGLLDLIVTGGLLTIFTAILGAVAVKYEIRFALILSSVSLVLALALLLFSGSYLGNLDVEQVRELWNDDSRTREDRDGFLKLSGLDRRTKFIDLVKEYQGGKKCCGFDSIFEYQLEPVCDESTLVDLPNPCKQFISTYFEESMGSVAGLAVAIGVIEVFAMLNLCALLFSEKDKVSDDIGQWHG